MKRRVIIPEMLDHVSDEDAAKNLADLVRLNRWLGGQRILRRHLRRLAPAADRFTFADIGAASGDAASLVQREYPRATAISVDLMPRNLRRAPHPKLVADAFALPFAQVDVVHAALFLHHFEDMAVIELLRGMRAVARRGVIIQDLHRHAIPYHFLPATRWLFGWNAVTLHDGPISVAAGFRRAELERLTQRAGWTNARIEWHPFAFRWSIVEAKLIY